MNKSDAITKLKEADQHKLYAFSRGDLWKLFPEEEEKTFEKSLQRLVTDGILERVTKGVYINPAARSKGAVVIEDVACVLRRGCFSYVSLEYALSEYGVISQAPVSRITIMTTGAGGTYDTPYGTIEFTHTKRRPVEVLQRSTPVQKHNLRVATKEAAIQDLRRVGRNVDMMDTEELNG
jgi:predicted transcriptional regulator of viral defense system